jgi:hypothetical protein
MCTCLKSRRNVVHLEYHNCTYYIFSNICIHRSKEGTHYKECLDEQLSRITEEGADCTVYNKWTDDTNLRCVKFSAVPGEMYLEIKGVMWQL